MTFQPTGHKGFVHSVELADDTSCEIRSYVRDKIMETPVHMVAAEPNTFLVGMIGDAGDEDDSPWQTPVIAWALTAEGFVVPVTVDGVNDDSTSSKTVLHSNGMVIEPANQSWRRYEDYLAEMRERRDEKAGKAT
ncbi:hypothetical protein BWQ93_05770 [Sphingopyxis sp. QXT-31]|nr:hypothetical protein BWQ93_05770 [Sphingopyxis sp. QXT-31]